LRARRKSEQKSELGALGLLIAAVVLGGIGLFLVDYRQVPFGAFGGLIWSIALFVSFMFGLLYFAQFVLPLRGNEGWTEGLRRLVRNYTLLGQQVLNGRPASSRSQSRGKKKQKPLADPTLVRLSPSFRKLKAGTLRSHQVLALAKGSGFSRAVGPGFVIFYRRETPTHLIDLRKQVRKLPVRANTRDGIPVDTAISVTFRVRRSEAEHLDDDIPYPYDKDAVFRVIYSGSIDAEDRFRPWTEQLCPQAATLFVTELAQYTLNELYQTDDAGVGPVDEIKQKIKRQMQQHFENDGIEILSVGGGKLKPPDSVMEQRIKTWRAEWEREIQMRYAGSSAEAVRRMQKARARAQVEIIENITQNIESMRRAESANLTEIITLRMIEALEQALSDSTSGDSISRHALSRLVMDASTQMQTWLNRPSEEQ
jgi:regulator of protease activity HflC (stomatin/prohibitin superfamily)